MVFSRLLLVCGCRRYVFFCYKLISTFSSRIQHVHSIHEDRSNSFFHTRTQQDDRCALSTNTCTKFNTTWLFINTWKACFFWELRMHFAQIFSFNFCTFLHFRRIFTGRNSLLFLWCCFVCSYHNKFSIWILKRALFFLELYERHGKTSVCLFVEFSNVQ